MLAVKIAIKLTFFVDCDIMLVNYSLPRRRVKNCIGRNLVYMNDIEKIFLAVVCALLVVGFIVFVLIREYILKTVKMSSHVLSELDQINGKIKYKNVERNYFYSYHCISRAEFNRFVLDNYFIEIIRDNKNFFQKLIKTIDNNKKEKAKYKRLLDKVDFSQTQKIAKSVKIPLRIYQYVETSCYRKMILSDPIIDVEIVCRKEYTTPAGRTHTWSDATYNYKNLLYFYEEAQKITEQREIRRGQIEYERSLMTQTLRYEILKRDNFRCQICGSTAQDGVKLHIDHIVPVSKGGHTTADNLRVLCDRCNLGKSNKLE